MEPTHERPFSLADYEPFLQTLSQSGIDGVLIGGLAVSSWAESFLDPNERTLFDLPIYSKDIDFRGQQATCTMVAKDMQVAGAEVAGMVTATRKNAPQMGKVYAISLHWRGHRTSIEALERLPGLDTSIDDPPVGTALVTHDGISLLDPCSLFICKMHAANSRQGDMANNDVKHLAILARVIPRFLAKLRAMPTPDYDGHEDARRLLLHLEACLSGQHPFRIPLSPEEIDGLTAALRKHLN